MKSQVVFDNCRTWRCTGPLQSEWEAIAAPKHYNSRCCIANARVSPTFPSLHLRHNSFSNPSIALPTSQLILQPFHRLTHVTAHSPTLPLLHLRHSSFYNPSFASPTSQALHLIHLASRPMLCIDCFESIGTLFNLCI